MVAVRTFKNWNNGGGLKIFHVNVGVSHNEGGGNPIQCWLHHGQTIAFSLIAMITIGILLR